MGWNRATVGLAVGPALLALLLRLYDLSGKPLWLDEIITYRRALLPLPELAADSFLNKHFPTYFVIAQLFDTPLIDEWMLRLPSALSGAAAVLLVTLIAAEVHSWRAGLVAGLLMAVSPIEVQFGQEARPYALASCMVMLALWGQVRIVKAAHAAPASPIGVSGAWAAYLVGTIAALNVLLVAAFWLLASNLAMAATLRCRGQRQLLRHWLLAQLVIVMTWLPGLIAISLAAGDDPLRGYRWIPQTTWPHIWSVLSIVYLFRAADIATFTILPGHIYGFGLVVVLAALFGAWRLKSDAKLFWLIGLTAITMPVAIAMISIVQPFWIPRYLLWGTGAFYVLAGVAVAALPRRLFPVAGAAFAIVGLINLAPYYRNETKARWDSAAAYLAANVAPGDAVVAGNATSRYVLTAYAGRYRLDRPVLNDGDISQVTPGFLGNKRVWLVVGRTGQAPATPAQAYLEKWAALGVPAAEIRFGQNVAAWRFDPPGGGGAD